MSISKSRRVFLPLLPRGGGYDNLFVWNSGDAG
jgi:hypothetical protein